MSQHNSRLVGGVYHVGQVITGDGMITSYTAYNRNTSEVVGLTVVEIPQGFDRQRIQALLQPLERRRGMSSPHVIRVYDCGIEGNRVYIASDPPRGVTLRHVLDNENIPLQRVVDLIRQIAQGIQTLHEQGIVGLDVRPQLITVNSEAETDQVQLDDLGLQLLLKEFENTGGQHSDTINHIDPRYASPEYLQSGVISPQGDMYDLGLVLFELVTGRVPFVGRTLPETAMLQSTAPVPRMMLYKHDTPAILQTLVDRMLAKNPYERFQSAAEVLYALSAIPPSQQLSANGWNSGGSTSPIGPEGERATTELAKADVTMSATLIEGRDTSPEIPVSPVSPVSPLPPGATVYAYLCYEKNGVEQKRFPMTSKNIIVGRADPKRGFTPDIDLTSLDPRMTVSRKHVRIRYEETFFYIEDLKSHNRTKLGELTLKEFSPELLQNGDIVQPGAVRLIFRVPETGR